MFVVVVRFELREGHEAAFDQILQETIEHVGASEPRTLCYFVSRVDGDPSTRIFVELFGDKEAFKAHEKRPGRKFMEGDGEHFVAARSLDDHPRGWDRAR
jgi:quinol monooxygenase YgiN